MSVSGECRGVQLGVSKPTGYFGQLALCPSDIEGVAYEEDGTSLGSSHRAPSVGELHALNVILEATAMPIE